MDDTNPPKPGLSRGERARLGDTHGAIPQLVEEFRGGRLGRRDFLRTVTLLGLSAGTAHALAGFPDGGGALAAETPKKGGILRCSMNVKEISDPATIDWTEKGNALRHVIEPLVRIGADNIARPHLAERWEASEDLKTWTFHLRKGVKWSNGDDFTADDVVFNITRWMDPATGSSNYGRFSALRESTEDGSKLRTDGVVKVDDHTVRFNLRVPFLALPESFGDYPALIAHRGFSGDFAKNPVGTGPFELVEYVVGGTARYKRRSTPWWGGEVYLDGVTYIDHGDDPAAPLAALASGQVDILNRAMNETIPALEKLPGVTLYEAKTAQTGVARMKVTEAPFTDVRVRRAVLACVDHDRLLRIAYQGRGIAGEDHHVAPVHPAYAKLTKPKRDIAKAKRLLAEAGYPKGIDLTIDCVAQPTWENNTCQALAEMLKPAGIRLKVNVMPGGTYWDRWLTAPFGFTSWTHRPIGTQVLSLAYRGGVPWNETSYANKAFDALLDEAEATLDVRRRRAIMAKLETMLRDDAVIVQPYWRSVFTAARSNVRGYRHHPADDHLYDLVWLA